MNKIHFEKLTPTKEVDLNTYREALDFIFADNEIKNIAITGSYSAGKSSVVESYKNENKDKKFLHISLANFESNDQQESKNSSRAEQGEEESKGNNEKTEYIKESVLEGKILNQLLHQIDISKIPQTKFKVKRTESDRSIITATVMLISFILCSLHIFYYAEWSKFVDSLRQFYGLRFLLITTKNISLLFSGITITIISTLCIFNFIKVQKHKNIFKRFKFNGNEIEIFEKSDESYFDKYLNEVLYIFENSDADVIVFEDIDRYNMNQIFQRLREVNTLVNSKRIIANNENQNNETENNRFGIFNNFKIRIKNHKIARNTKKPLRFFYLVKDDIFLSKDRTKFFDFIMPVVPVIDSSNSYDQFISHFKKGNVFKKFDEYFLQGISLYVDDMRILKNIYNEFIIYYNRIGTTEQDYNKLLAMIVYKNIFPRDFSETQINVGFVSTLFENKDVIIKDSIDEIDNKIHQIENKINLYKEEHLENIDELEKIYTKTNYYESYIDTQNPKYIKRKEIIELKQHNKLDEMENELNELNSIKIKIKSERIANLITRENIDEVFDVSYKNFLDETNDFNEIKSSQYFELIKYLIWNGYIDETYEDYMTYFYENSLTRNDKMFLRSVTDRKAKEWRYNINNPKIVLSRLREVDFEEVETLNFDLFRYILQNQSRNEKYLIKFIEQLKKELHFKFMEGYFSSTEDITIYVKSMNKYWPSFLEKIYLCREFTYEQKKEHILQALYYFDNTDIEQINENGFLTKTISSDEKFLNIESPNVKKLIDKFLDLNIKFECINFDESNKVLFDAVYENKLYEFNYENILLILKNVFKIENESDIKNKNYSIILKDASSKFLEYVNENIQSYMEIIIKNCDDKILDTQEAALKLINNNDIAFIERKEYILLLQTQLNLLGEIQDKELWETCLQYNKVEYSMDNIFSYYFGVDKRLNETLVNFINSDNFDFEFYQENIDGKFGENSANDIFISITECETIKEENYRNIIEQFSFVYPNPTLGIQKLSEERIKILIELDKFKVTSENIEFLQSNYSDLLLYFIQLNIEEYIDGIKDFPKVTNENLMKLLSSSIEDCFKIELISNSNDVIPISQINCSDEVKSFIINNNFDELELTYLIDSYEDFSDLVKENINDLCLEYISSIVQDKIELNYNLLMNILNKDNISEEIRLKLLTNNIDKMSRLQVKDAIEAINLSEHKKIFTNGRPRFEINDANREFLSKCKDKKWISDFNEEECVFKIKRRGIKVNSDTKYSSKRFKR
ncbi:hypothetical protein [Romboutsia hominis]|uniref:YobI family P-loop NTPase n=1 Tax=Romboutsia hominis TaxID=1507512 RepID=UPI001F06003C|nr:hypothetical protein [Romboutsia hominis]MCH1959922.1 hypothetical protein [Romboutsia hominis]MCH1969655.1 hypothetical protein [Romboutsia hominis]